MEQALARHMKECDQIDEYAFCIGCGEKVYLHDHSTYQGVGDDVLCLGCSVDAAAIDAAQMKFADWQEHWAVRDGELVTAQAPR